MIVDRNTNLEWALDSPAIKILRDPTRRSTWVCGDHNKLRRAVSYFVKHTSIHGVQFIWNKYRKLSLVKRIGYQLFFVACVLMMLGSEILLLQDSLSTESIYITVTDKDSENGMNEDPYFPRHPKIYICRRPSYRVDVNASYRELLEYAYLSLGYPYISLTPNEISLLIKSILYQFQGKSPDPEMQVFAIQMEQLSTRYKQLKDREQNFNLTHFLIENSIKCEDVFITCQFFIFPLDCCKEFKPVLTNVGVCFSYELSNDRLEFMMRNKELSYFLLFDMHTAPRIPKAVNTGYEIFLLDPRYQDRVFPSAGYYTINGHQLSMKANLVKTARNALYTPWHGLYTKCPQLDPEFDPMGYGERYFKASCVRNHVTRLARKKCGCRIITDNTNMTLKECTIEEQYCLNSVMLRDNLTGVSEACKHPCVEYHYDITTSLVKIGNNNISRLVFVYESNQYSLEEYKRTTFSSSLSQLGGASGLYIGASIISALEVFLLVMSCIWYRFLPHKRVSNPSEIKRMKKKDIHGY